MDGGGHARQCAGDVAADVAACRDEDLRCAAARDGDVGRVSRIANDVALARRDGAGRRQAREARLQRDRVDGGPVTRHPRLYPADDAG